MQRDDFSPEMERALASYADPAGVGEPPQMTARVLASIGKNEKRKRRWRWTFIFVVPEFALLLAAAIFLRPSACHMERLTPQELALSVTSAPPAQQPDEQAAAPRLQRVEVTKVRRVEQARQERLPKLDVFPAPTPLTEQEKLLVRYVSETPREQQIEIVKAQQEATKPLQITPLSIAPIDLNAPISQP